MANNTNLGAAKAAKNDEFYTQYADIQKEVNAYLEYNPDTFRDKTVLLPCDDPEWSNFTRFFAQNFERLGLKRLISTSYAVESKKYKDYEPTLFETESPLFDIGKTRIKGKIFELTRDTNGSGRIDIDDLEWHYLEGDGDFRSPEVCALRDQSDIIVTNPPFSLFREFISWIMEAHKQFLIIGHQGAVGYKEIFPLIKDNRLWLGIGFTGGAAHFYSPYEDYAVAGDHKKGMIRVSGVTWFTNLEHGRRHEPLKLMTMKDNLRYGKHKDMIERGGYERYYHYNFIDVPYTDAIPSDYNEEMGVPITYLAKHCPEQFEILGMSTFFATAKPEGLPKSKQGGPQFYVFRDGEYVRMYNRIIIRKKQ
ncbi:MAG: adenine-specific methyltransferase EcoRI family protein [Bacteroidales bacterium]|nr:adenine-specific methyltransferase EcoRI family protein [Bacteroidales bacterium]